MVGYAAQLLSGLIGFLYPAYYSVRLTFCIVVTNSFYHSFLITISSISIMITTLHLMQGPGEQTERRGAQVFNKNLLNLFRGTMHKLLFNLVILLNSIIHGERFTSWLEIMTDHPVIPSLNICHPLSYTELTNFMKWFLHCKIGYHIFNKNIKFSLLLVTY